MTVDSAQDAAVTGEAAVVSPAPRRRVPRASSPRTLPTVTGEVSGAPQPVSASGSTPHIRSSALLLINEDLARARMREMERSAEDIRRAYRLVAARQWRRRASNASRRARMAQNAIW
jgi:hypothetical protein